MVIRYKLIVCEGMSVRTNTAEIPVVQCELARTYCSKHCDKVV